MRVYVSEEKFHKAILTLTMIVSDMFYFCSLKMNPMSWFHNPLVAYHLQFEKHSSTRGKVIVRVDGKKRHSCLIESSVPSRLFTRVEILFSFSMPVQLAKSWGANVFVQTHYHQQWMDISQNGSDSSNSETINQQDEESLKTHNTYTDQQKHSKNQEKNVT